MSDKKYPSHFTADDIQRIDAIENWLQQNDVSQVRLARLARLSPSTLNQILQGTYLSSPAKMLDRIDSAMRNMDGNKISAITTVETSLFKLVQRACDMARRYHNFSVISAYVGTGKTYALKHYAAKNDNTFLVETTPSANALNFLSKLAFQVTNLEKRTMDDSFNVIVNALKNTDSLIIVDEAEMAAPKVLHILRRIRDIANIGIVLAGTEQLNARLKPQHGQFDQSRSRTMFWPPVFAGITEDDAAALIQASFDEDVSDNVIKSLYRYSNGSARMLVEGLIASIKEFRGNNELSDKLVDAVAQQALCLSA